MTERLRDHKSLQSPQRLQRAVVQQGVELGLQRSGKTAIRDQRSCLDDPLVRCLAEIRRGDQRSVLIDHHALGVEACLVARLGREGAGVVVDLGQAFARPDAIAEPVGELAELAFSHRVLVAIHVRISVDDCSPSRSGP